RTSVGPGDVGGVGELLSRQRIGVERVEKLLPALVRRIGAAASGGCQLRQGSEELHGGAMPHSSVTAERIPLPGIGGAVDLRDRPRRRCPVRDVPDVLLRPAVVARAKRWATVAPTAVWNT